VAAWFWMCSFTPTKCWPEPGWLYWLAPSAGSTTCLRVTASLVPLLSLTVRAVPAWPELGPIRPWLATGDACGVLAGREAEPAGDRWDLPGWECAGEQPPRASAAA